MWALLGGCFRKVFVTTFNNSKKVNSSGTNSMTNFLYSVILLPFLVFVKKASLQQLENLLFIFTI